MAYEQKEGWGTLFNNDKKTGNQPDMRGEAKLNGEIMEIAAWRKEGGRGEFISLSIKPKGAGFAPKQAKVVEDDDDIPFS